MSVFRDLVDELKAKCRLKYGPYASWHEAHSVLREEFEEFWDEVKRKEAERDPEKLLSELVDIVNVAERAAEDFKLVSVEPANVDERETYYAGKYQELSQAVINFLTVATEVKNNLQQARPVNPRERLNPEFVAEPTKIATLLVQREYLDELERLVENDRVLPA
jgi:hypothetical protein